jgi:uncharacterized alkaline shock family protein YloU
MTQPEPALSVSDLVVAKIAAQAAADTPGVARLAPSLTTVIKSTLTKAARSLINQPEAEAGRADPGAAEITHTEGELTQITIRIIASGTPPVLPTVNAVHLAIHHAVQAIAPMPVDVTVLVVDTEPVREADHSDSL